MRSVFTFFLLLVLVTIISQINTQRFQKTDSTTNCPLGQYTISTPPPVSRKTPGNLRILRESSDENCAYCYPACSKCRSASQTECDECVQGYYFEKNECFTCSIGCKTCVKMDIYCLSCNQGYFFYERKQQCIKCEVRNCLNCDSNFSKCDECPAQSYYDEKAYKCLKCHPSCSKCENDQPCSECPSKYFMANSELGYWGCKECSKECEFCKKSPENCTKCIIGYYLFIDTDSKNQKCALCHPSCEQCVDDTPCGLCPYGEKQSEWNQIITMTRRNLAPLKCITPEIDNCSVSKQKCYQCQFGYYANKKGNGNTSEEIRDVIKGGPRRRQLSEDYRDSVDECVKCHENCLGCSNSETCDKCSEGYYYYENYGGQFGLITNFKNCVPCHKTCTKGCTDGRPCSFCGLSQVFEHQQCVNCHPTCISCEDSLKPCSEQKCEIGQYFNRTISENKQRIEICEFCYPTCASCKDGQQNTCLSCKSGYYLDAFTNSCLSCSNECIGCKNSESQCEMCAPGYGIQEIILMRKLQRETEGEIQQFQCIQCSVDNCKYCDYDQDICVQCFEGYYYDKQDDECKKCHSSCTECNNGEEICTVCPRGFFSLQKDRESYFGCQACHKICENCVSEKDCLSCAVGYYYEKRQGTLNCLPCHSSCYSCTNSQKCTDECKPGQYQLGWNVADKAKSDSAELLRKDSGTYRLLLPSTLQCEVCPFENCSVCLGKLICQQCMIGYYGVKDPKQIEQEKKEAEMQNAQTETKSRMEQVNEDARKRTDKSDYTKTGMEREKTQTGTHQAVKGYIKCAQCPLNCERCENEIQCQTCSQGYYLEQVLSESRRISDQIKFECVQCHKTCINGCYDGEECVTNCEEGYVLDSNNQCVIDTNCKPGMFFNGKQCEDCSYMCKECNKKADNCTVCNLGYNRSLFEISKVENQCQCNEGYYSEDKEINCRPCSSKCKSCDNKHQCTQCLNKAFLPPLCQRPVNGFFSLIDQDQIYESKCNVKCEKCDSQNVCLTCVSGLNRVPKLPECGCKDGYHDESNTQKDCQQCNLECSTCISQTQCTSCKEELFRKLNNQTGVCECIPGFKEVFGVLECQKCYMLNDQCLLKCPSNSIQNEDTHVCQQLEYEFKDNVLLISLSSLSAIFLFVAIWAVISKMILNLFNFTPNPKIENSEKPLQNKDGEVEEEDSEIQNQQFDSQLQQQQPCDLDEQEINEISMNGRETQQIQKQDSIGNQVVGKPLLHLNSQIESQIDIEQVIA